MACSELGLANVLLAEWAQIPIDTLQNLVKSLPLRVEAVCSHRGGRSGPNSIIMAMVLEWTYIDVKVWCSQTFNHIVYI